MGNRSVGMYKGNTNTESRITADKFTQCKNWPMLYTVSLHKLRIEIRLTNDIYNTQISKFKKGQVGKFITNSMIL